MCYFVLFVCSVSWLFFLGCQYHLQVIHWKDPSPKRPVRNSSAHDQHPQRDILYDYKVELTGIGNRNQINTDDNLVL